jgi:T5SS/PEP-CTERM-associated repeat protein
MLSSFDTATRSPRAVFAQIAIAICAIFVGFHPSAAIAATTNWATATGGSFTDPANWTSGVPTSADTAVFRLGNVQYSSDLTGNVTIGRLRIGTNTVNLTSSSGGTLTVSGANSGANPTAIVGELAGDNATLNMSLPTFTSKSVYLGDAAGSQGTLNVLGGTFNSLTLIGGNGDGTMNVSNGAIVTGTGRVGGSASSNGKLTLDGAGTTWNGQIEVGSSGMGEVLVTNGAKINGTINLGIQSFDQAKLTIDGLGSAVTSPSLGGGGSSTVIITNGGKLTATIADLFFARGDIFLSNGGQLIVASQDFSIGRGTINIDGVDSLLQVPRLNPNQTGGIPINITGGGILTSGNSVIGDADATAPSIVTVDGAGSKWMSSGGLSFGNDLRIKNGGVVSAARVGTDAITSVDGPQSKLEGSEYIRVDGELRISGGATVTAGRMFRSVLGPNQAKIDIRDPGSKLITSTLSTTADLQIDVADESEFWLDLLFLSSGAKATGNAKITGNVQNYSGILAPGAPIGRWSVLGDFTQNTGALQIELGGPAAGSYDRLTVSGLATLNGRLDVSLLNSFTPSLGDSFDILDWGMVAGTFATLQLPTLPNLAWDTSRLYTDGIISVVPEPSSGWIVLIALSTLLMWRRSHQPAPLAL